MINAFRYREYRYIFALILQSGFDLKLSSDVIEERITKSKYVTAMYHDLDIIIKDNSDVVIKEIYGSHIQIKDTVEDRFLWMSYIYTDLFFDRKKPFDYIFLYLPFNDLFNMFPLYHEMDNSFVYVEFDKRRKISLLDSLLNKYGISKKELSISTRINYNTIVKYSLDDSNLYHAGLDNIYKIATFLNVDLIMFVEKLILTSETIFKGDEKYKEYLSLVAASYKSAYHISNFELNNDNYYVSDVGKKVFVLTSNDEIKTFLNNHYEEECLLIVDDEIEEPYVTMLNLSKHQYIVRIENRQINDLILNKKAMIPDNVIMFARNNLKL